MTLLIRNATIAGPDRRSGPHLVTPSSEYPGGKLDLEVGPEVKRNVLLEAGKIAGIGDDRLEAPMGAQTLDASGLIATPGWIDIQLNGGFGHDFTEDPASIWEVGAQLPSLGLTAFLPTIISCPPEKLAFAIETFRRGPPAGWQGAIPLGLHLEGPLLNPAKKGAHNPAYLRSPDLEAARHWTRSAGVCLVTLAPELPGALDVIHLLRINGVIVSGGHTTARYDEALTAFDAGMTCSTHLFNAQPPLGHREPGFCGAVLEDERVFSSLIADAVHVHPAMVQLAWACKGERLILVTDAVAALGMPPGRYSVGDFSVIVDETSVRLADGTLAGSNATPERCVRNLARWAGCSVAEAAAAMSTAPARLLGRTEREGIVEGASANLTLITAEGRVAATIVDGKLVFADSPLESAT